MFFTNERVMDTITGELATVTWHSTDTFDVQHDGDDRPSQLWPHTTTRFKKITEQECSMSVQPVKN